MINLLDDIKYLQGVGPKRAELLASELQIRTVEDLLFYFPYKYIDRSKFYHVNEANNDSSYIQMRGKLRNIKKVGEGRALRLSAMFYDETGQIELVWFKGIRYVEPKLNQNQTYVVFGKPSRFNNSYNIAHPELDVYSVEVEKKIVGWQAHYNTTEKMKKNFLTSSVLRSLVYVAISSLTKSIEESLPAYLIEKYKLMSLHESIVNIHFPKNQDALRHAQTRLKFEELFYIQLSILKQTKLVGKANKGFVFGKIGNLFHTLYSVKLPFDLTNAQKRVLREIRADVGSGLQMNRLLQGDVGSGKTLVALFSMLMAIDNNYQTCLMAPTEILAIQHYQTIRNLLDEMDVSVALLTGSTKKQEREKIHASLLNGSLNLLIGTHALLEDSVQFQNLGLVVIDEQHRFGVAQRAKLWKKNFQPPHVLVMTATPIPRTLAMTVYGDLEISVIDELPPGRKPVHTYHYYEDKHDDLLRFLKKEIDLGRQAYIVYPLIQESEKIDLKNLEEGYELISSRLPQYKISMVHGKLKPQEKDDEMDKFLRGETQIMIATTVIEVGVNVPNASVMVIESAQRFGLSQLHQLRGRVGRGAEQSYCILITPYKLSSDTKKRIDALVETNDGFVIAEADLRLRGPGDMDGTLQSGMPFELKIADLSHDSALLTLARTIATDVLTDDPELKEPQHQILSFQLRRKNKNQVNWSQIS